MAVVVPPSQRPLRAIVTIAVNELVARAARAFSPTDDSKPPQPLIIVPEVDELVGVSNVDGAGLKLPVAAVEDVEVEVVVRPFGNVPQVYLGVPETEVVELVDDKEVIVTRRDEVRPEGLTVVAIGKVPEVVKVGIVVAGEGGIFRVVLEGASVTLTPVGVDDAVVVPVVIVTAVDDARGARAAGAVDVRQGAAVGAAVAAAAGARTVAIGRVGAHAPYTRIGGAVAQIVAGATPRS